MRRKILLLSTCAIFLFTGCFSSKNKSNDLNNAEDIKIKINDTKDLKLNTYFTDNSELIFSVTNKGSELIDYVNIDVAFYDEKGNLIRTDKQYARNINVNQENFSKMNLVQYDEKGNIILPYKIEVVLNKTIYSSKYETTYNDKIEANVSKSDEEGQLNLNIKNNSGEVLDDINVAVVFYKDSKPVNVQVSSFQSVESTTSQIIYVPTVISDDNVKMLDYDDVKVVVNNASKYIAQ